MILLQIRLTLQEEMNKMAKDPVYKMNVNEKKAAKVKHKGKTYYFCSPTCQWAFKENPKQFVKGR